jgi:hypothetical protein
LLGALLLYVVLLLRVPAVWRTATTEAGQFTGYLFATGCCLFVALRAPAGRGRQAWLWIALAFGSNTLAEGIYGDLVLVQQLRHPFPSAADPFYLLFYPLMAIGALLLPSAPSSGPLRLTLLLDVLIMAGALFGVTWFFLIGPTYFQGADSAFGLGLSVAYPLGDFVLIVSLSVLALRGVHPGYLPVYAWLVAGLVCTIYADAAYTYLGLGNAYADGLATVDPLWPAGAFLMGLAPLYQLARFGRRGLVWTNWQGGEAWQFDPSLLRIVLPYVPVVILLGMLWVGQLPGADARLFPVLEGGAGLVVVLMIARQVLTLRENARLARRQREALNLVAEANAQLAEYTNQLEEGIEHLNQVQVQVARGDYSARVTMLEGRLLFPVAAMFNRLLDRFERLARGNVEHEQLAALALHLAQICHAAEAGDRSALQELSRTSGTPLDAIARLLVRLDLRLNELDSSRPSGPSRPAGT